MAFEGHIQTCYFCKKRMKDVTPKNWKKARRYVCKSKDHIVFMTVKEG